MIDEPGPWGTGPFDLAEGHSRLDVEEAVVHQEPFAATWLWHHDRTPRVRLVANTGFWDERRGPHLREVVFRNDIESERALELVCTTEGEVDIMTGVSPADAERVERSEHARLVEVDAMRAVAGVINRDADGLPLGDRRAREACLAEKEVPREWDILLLEQTTQTADAPTLELHRAFAGESGEYRAGPVVPEFEALWAELRRQTSLVQQIRVQNRIDRFVYDRALALFLCAPRALHAVNRHVDFTPYHTSFELAECEVSEEHWSRR